MFFKVLKFLAGSLSVWLFMMLLLVLAVDALEFQTTGECRECLILSR